MRTATTVLLMMIAAAGAAAGEMSVSVGAVNGNNKEFGSLTPTDWRLHDERGLMFGMEWFFWRNVSIAGSAADIHEHVRYNSARIGSMRSVPTSLMFQLHGPDGLVRPYIGAGVSNLMYRDVRSAYGVPQQPDHAAAIVAGGVDYALSNRWALNFDVKYGPARSTAEIALPDGATQHVDFHQMYSSLAIRCRF